MAIGVVEKRGLFIVFLKRNVKKSSGNFLDMTYVSLYGIQNTEDLTQSLYIACHPLLGGKVGKFGKFILKRLLKSSIKIDISEANIGKVDLSLGLPDFESNPKKPWLQKLSFSKTKKSQTQRRIFVFDDLERAVMPVTDILAFIQPLIESKESRMIFVSNENEIAHSDPEEKKRYNLTKEKSIYLNFKIKENMIETFIQSIEKIYECFSKNYYMKTESIFSIFMDLGRNFFNAVDQKYHSHKYTNHNIIIAKTLYGILITRNLTVS